MVGDGASANDVAVCHVCKELNPKKRYLKPKEVQISYIITFLFWYAVSVTDNIQRCIDHSMHRAAYHFIKTLHIPSFTKAKRALQAVTEENDDRSEKENNSQPEDSDDEGDNDIH